MQAIGFNEHYGLQTAVFNRTKTITRRAEKGLENLEEGNFCFQKERNQVVIYGEKGTPIEIVKLRYKIGEIVAVRQSYSEIADNPYFINQLAANGKRVVEMKYEEGWNNKLFVAAYYMPRHIKITDIKVERLQDCSDDDILKEGIIRRDDCINNIMENIPVYTFKNSFVNHIYKTYHTPRQAFARLIDKVSGKGTWERNQFMPAYTFELID